MNILTCPPKPRLVNILHRFAPYIEICCFGTSLPCAVNTGLCEDKKSESRREQCEAWLKHLGQRRMTNILVEGGGQLLGSLFDANLIDEAHIFIAPKLIGGEAAPSPLAGLGRTHVSETPMFTESTMQILDSDFYFHGRMR